MFDLIERGLYWVSSFVLEGDVDAHCQLRAPLTDKVAITMSDDLLSFIEIRGSRKLVGDKEFEQMAVNLSAAMGKVMKFANGQQHSFAIGFRSAPGSAARLLKEILEPTLRTSRRLGISETVHLSDQITALADKCSEESAYVVLYTHVAGLSPNDRKRVGMWREETAGKYAKAAPGMRLSDDMSQRPRVPPPAIIPRHTSAVDIFIQDLTTDIEKGGVGILAEVMDVGTGMAVMRRHMDASSFDSSWRPRLLGDKSKGTVLPGLATRQKDASHMTPMRLGRQLVPDPLIENFGDVEYVKRGGLYYGGVVLEVPPEDGSLPFASLAARIGRTIPWTVNMQVIPNGSDLRKIDQMYAGFVGAMGDHNRRVKEGWTQLKELKRSGVYISALRVTFTTWASSADQMLDRVSFLKSSIESWGSAVVTNETGAPGIVALNAAAGFAKRMPAPYCPGPLPELARMMPLFRPASVWSSGHLITHTKEGRPYPIALGSTEQLYWGTLIFAPSGYGKSFLMNMLNAGIMLSPGLEDLPYLTIIDVGPSSRLVMDQIRSMLPAERRREVVSIRIRNTREFAVNAFDTQLGCDMPTEVDKDFQVAVVSTLCPTLGKEGERFIGQVIAQAYKMLGRRSPGQRRWQNSMDETVSKAVQEIGLEVSDKTFVYDIVDALFDAGRIADASIAQRYAVPVLADLIKASRDKEILDAYGEAPSETGERLVDVFTRSIQTALSEYELIAGVTKFEVGAARAISIDLEEVVTGTDSEEGKRRAALMFLFGRRLGAKNYFLRWDEIGSIVPDRYRAYQETRIRGLEESLKFLEYDEVHYASGIPSMAKRIGEDLRVGRKYKCVTVMASQLLEDFPKAAVDNCYTFFILGVGTDLSLEKLQATFGLSHSETMAIKTECTGPGKLFALFKTSKGTTSQVLYTTAGPFNRWSYSTSKDDAVLRSDVTKYLDGDYLKALKLLAEKFPGGSARDEMERFRRARGDSASGESVIDVFARRVVSAE